MFKCRCGGEMDPETALVITESTDAMDGVVFVVYPAKGIDSTAVEAFGVCGIPCAARRFTEKLQEMRGVKRTAHMAPETPMLDEMATVRDMTFVKDEEAA